MVMAVVMALATYPGTHLGVYGPGNPWPWGSIVLAMAKVLDEGTQHLLVAHPHHLNNHYDWVERLMEKGARFLCPSPDP